MRSSDQLDENDLPAVAASKQHGKYPACNSTETGNAQNEDVCKIRTKYKILNIRLLCTCSLSFFCHNMVSFPYFVGLIPFRVDME